MKTSCVGLSRKWTCFWFAAAMALCQPVGATASESPVVVLYDLEARGVEPYLASSFTDLLCVELSHVEGIDARCKSDIDTILEHTANRQLMGCRDDACRAEISNALGADYILRGSITKFQDSLMLIVSRVKSREATKSAHFKETVSGQPEALLSVVHRAALHLSKDITTQAAIKADNTPAPNSAVSISPALQTELSQFVDAWKKSWQDTATTQSLNDYQSFYSRQFYSEYGRKDYDGWMKDKARKLLKKRDISIELGPKGFFWTGGDEYTVTFLQHYKSTNYQDKGLKVLRLRREMDSWKIVAEEWRNQ